MKALEKDRDRRDETASGFAADIRRFLADEPVVARPPSRGYRLRKFVARNKGQVVAASLVIVALVAGIVGTTLGMVEARKQRDIAEREYRRARAAVDDSFVKVSENKLLNVPGMQLLRKELLGSARAYYQQFLEDRALDPSLKADLARTQSRLGLIAAALNQRAEAHESYRSAASMYEALAASEPKVWRHRFDQAVAIDRQGALLLDETGRLDDAERAIRRSQSLFEALARSRPGDAEIQSFLAGSYANLAEVAGRRGDNETATTLRRQYLELRRKSLREHPDDVDLLNELADAERRCAGFAHVLGRENEAREGFQQAVVLYERLVEKQPGAVTARYDVSVTLQNQGRMHFEHGHAETGRLPLERGLAIEEVLVRENPLVGEYRAGLAFAHNPMSDLDRAAGKLKEAGQHALAARDLLETLVREAPDSLVYRESLAKASNMLGRAALAGGRPDEARQAFARAVEILESMPDPPSWYLYNLACNKALAVPLAKAAERPAQVKRAISALKRAFASGFTNAEAYRQDTDLDSLRNELAFQQFLRGVGSAE